VEAGYGLSEHAHKRAKKLSGGTQRKLSAAMALSCGTPARGEWPPPPWLARPVAPAPALHGACWPPHAAHCTMPT